MTGRARFGNGAVVHLCGLQEIRRGCMAGIAIGGGWNVARGLTARDRIVMAATARRRRTLKNTARVAGFTGYEFVWADKWKSSRQMVKVEKRLRDGRGKCVEGDQHAGCY